MKSRREKGYIYKIDTVLITPIKLSGFFSLPDFSFLSSFYLLLSTSCIRAPRYLRQFSTSLSNGWNIFPGWAFGQV